MAKPPSEQPTVAQGSSLSFTQGFLLGQLSIALLIFCFIKFFIFGEPPPADERAFHLSSLRRARTLAHQRTRSASLPLRHKHSRSIIRNPAQTSGPSINTILAKTYYNVKGHQPESLDWFNVLIAQTIAQLRADARLDGAVLTSLTEVLNGPGKPDWIGGIRVTEIALGDEFPIFSNCRVMPAEEGFGGSIGAASEEGGRLQARIDVDLSDVITLGIETTLVLNYPKPLVAVLPVALAVSVVRFSGTLALSFIPSSTPPSTSTSTPHGDGNTNPSPHQPNTPQKPPEPPRPSRPTTLAFTFLDDYRLDLSVRSLVGSRSRLQDVPKIAQLIEARVHAWFDERAVEPRFQQIVLPSLWPRKKNTRGGEEEEKETAEGEGEGETSGEEAVVGNTQNRNMNRDTAPLRSRPTSFATTVSTAVPGSLEERMEAEGAKLREAEIRAGERPQGMRWRGEGLRQRDLSRQPNRDSGEWSGARGMPGALGVDDS